MNNEIIMLKLYNGDYIIGEKNTDTKCDYMVFLNNPRVFVFMPTMTGTMKAGFQPVCFFNKRVNKAIGIRDEQIMFVVENEDIPKEIENGYKTEVTGISVANASDIAAVNSSKEKTGGLII